VLPGEYEGGSAAPRAGAAGLVRAAESGEQLTAAADPGLGDDGLEVVLDRVAGDEEPLCDGARVEPCDECGDDLALALGERVGAAEQLERLGRCRRAQRGRDLPVDDRVGFGALGPCARRRRRRIDHGRQHAERSQHERVAPWADPSSYSARAVSVSRARSSEHEGVADSQALRDVDGHRVAVVRRRP
jgi:hypothetical protein